MTDEMKAGDVEGGMHKRPVRMSDGRYLIFYTFGETDAERVEHRSEPQQESQAAAVAEEERRV